MEKCGISEWKGIGNENCEKLCGDENEGLTGCIECDMGDGQCISCVNGHELLVTNSQCYCDSET